MEPIVSDVAAARKTDVAPSAAIDVPIEVTVQPDEPAASNLEVSVDVDEFDGSSAKVIATASAPATVDTGIEQPELWTSPFSAPRPSIRRRALLYGSIGAVAVIGLVAIALGSRSPTPRRVGVTASASAASFVESPAVAPDTASAAAAAPQTTAEPAAASATAAVAAEPAAASAAQTAEGATEATDEEAKIMISVKPDGSVLVYKGKVVGRTPFILKQPRGEKRTYEIGKPGYATRRIVINGTERSIGFELGLDVPHPDSL